MRTEIAAKNNPDLIQELKKFSRKPNSELFDLRTNNNSNHNQLYGYEEPKLNETHEHEPEINSIDDCIDGIEEPLYGLVILITLVEDQPCQIKNTTYEKPTYREPKTYRGKRDVPYSQYKQPEEPELPFCDANAPIISKTGKLTKIDNIKQHDSNASSPRWDHIVCTVIKTKAVSHAALTRKLSDVLQIDRNALAKFCNFFYEQIFQYLVILPKSILHAKYQLNNFIFKASATL